MSFDVLGVVLDIKLTLLETGVTFIANSISLLFKKSICLFNYNIDI